MKKTAGNVSRLTTRMRRRCTAPLMELLTTQRRPMMAVVRRVWRFAPECEPDVTAAELASRVQHDVQGMAPECGFRFEQVQPFLIEIAAYVLEEQRCSRRAR